MSKNVRIDNENTTHIYNGIDRLRTAGLDGQSVDWVPQGTYSDHINKGSITITENGTYLPSDYGYDAFSEITVSLGDNEGDTYTDDGTTIDTSITYDLPDDGDTNATYSDSDIEDYYKHTEWESVDVENVSVEIPDTPVDTIATNTLKGPGTITGIDPETGELTTVSTDANGNIKKTLIPFFLSVINPPTTTTYAEGDTIDFSGLVCGAYYASGSEYELDDGTNIVPTSELTFPVTIATTGNVTEGSSTPNETLPSSGSNSGSTSGSGNSDTPETPEVEG